MRDRPWRSVRRARNLLAHLRQVATEERIRSAAVSYGRLDYPAAAIHLRLTTRHEFHRLKSCEKEPWTVRWIERCLEPGEVLYDVGANVGAYTLLAAVVSPSARVVCFEPGPANFAALAANIELNDVAERVIAVPIALGDQARSATLRSDSPVAGASAALDGDGGPGRPAMVLVDRLDDVVRRFGLPHPHHLKLDVDGYEREVLEGAPEILDSDALRTMMVELDHRRGDEVVDRLTRLGFRLAERSSGPDRTPSTPTYGLFLRG